MIKVIIGVLDHKMHNPIQSKKFSTHFGFYKIEKNFGVFVLALFGSIMLPSGKCIVVKKLTCYTCPLPITISFFQLKILLFD